jgi:hypothetical protein
VSVFGNGVERLTATAAEAVARGLHVWIHPRLEAMVSERAGGSDTAVLTVPINIGIGTKRRQEPAGSAERPR